MNSSIVLGMIACLMISTVICQDYDGENENYGNNNGGDEGYGNYGGGGDDGYAGYQPNNNQNSGVAAESSDNQPGYSSSQGGSDADGDYENDEIARAASNITPTITRVRRSILAEQFAQSVPKIRVKRWGKHYIGPVYTYVKTDKHANFKWGVKHKVGKKHG